MVGFLNGSDVGKMNEIVKNGSDSGGMDLFLDNNDQILEEVRFAGISQMAPSILFVFFVFLV